MYPFTVAMLFLEEVGKAARPDPVSAVKILGIRYRGVGALKGLRRHTSVPKG